MIVSQSWVSRDASAPSCSGVSKALHPASDAIDEASAIAVHPRASFDQVWVVINVRALLVRVRRRLRTIGVVLARGWGIFGFFVRAFAPDGFCGRAPDR